MTISNVALNQLEKQGCEVVPVCELNDIKKYGDRDHKQVFVLDDVLGIFALDMHICNHIINHKEIFHFLINSTWPSVREYSAICIAIYSSKRYTCMEKLTFNLHKPDRVLSFTVYDQSSYIVADRILYSQ
jgi:hypothetical protein